MPPSVAAFGDPGLGGARELFDFPDRGHGRGGDADRLHARPLLRHRELLARSLEPWFAEIVAWHGLSGPLRCHPVPSTKRLHQAIEDVAEEEKESAAGRSGATGTVTNDAADVVILAGAPLAGLANEDPRSCARPAGGRHPGRHVSMAEGLVRLKPRKATARHVPPARPQGLDGPFRFALANVIASS